jgi:hypothetical protein
LLSSSNEQVSPPLLPTAVEDLFYVDSGEPEAKLLRDHAEPLGLVQPVGDIEHFARYQTVLRNVRSSGLGQELQSER